MLFALYIEVNRLTLEVIVVNIQMTMTNVEKWPCLIYDCSFFNSL